VIPGIRTILTIVFLILVIALATVRICGDGGAMAAAYQSCECGGWEWTLYDRAAADGPRRSLCVGFVRSWTCYQSRGGPIVACPD
jgi:hypothetical protein